MNSWDEKFQSNDYIYGRQPNEWLRAALGGTENRKIALLAEGEGRNAIYLARLGNQVTTYDFSQEGIGKTKRLADEENVTVDTNLQDITVRDALPRGAYDISVNIFGHVPKGGKYQMFSNLVNCVKPGGFIIFELYSKRQIEFKTGGPPNVDMLYDTEEIKTMIEDLSVETLHLEEINTFRQEGRMHNGQSVVIQGKLRKL